MLSPAIKNIKLRIALCNEIPVDFIPTGQMVYYYHGREGTSPLWSGVVCVYLVSVMALESDGFCDHSFVLFRCVHSPVLLLERITGKLLNLLRPRLQLPRL